MKGVPLKQDFSKKKWGKVDILDGKVAQKHRGYSN